MNTRLSTFIIPFIFILLWSSGYIFVESGLKDSTPLAFLSLRFILAFLILFFIYLFKATKQKISFNDFLIMCVTGIFLQGFYLGFFFLTLNTHLPSGVLAIVLGLQPLAMALILRENLYNAQKVGLIFGIIGLLLTVLSTIKFGNTKGLGVFYSFLSLLGITSGTFLQKKNCSKYPLLLNMMIQYLSASILIVFSSLIFERISVNWTLNFIISLSWVSIVMSIIAFFLFQWLLNGGKASKVTSLLYCVPPVASIMDYFIFGQTLSIITIVGMFFVMMSMALIYKKKARAIVECDNI
jgi:drug/metabolite transporter (DMT)-like permease